MFFMRDNMGDDFHWCCGCIFVIFIIFAGASLLGNVHWNSDDFDATDIYISNFDCAVNHYSDDTYMYDVFYNLENVSKSFENSEVITYFYSDDKVVLSDEVTYLSNNTTQSISYDDIRDYNIVYVSAFVHSDNFTNITHVKIVMIKDDEIIFNTTMPFDMDNIEEVNLDDDSLDDDKLNDGTTLGFTDEDENLADDTVDTYSNGETYVGSSNSDKFHYPSCPHAKRIKDYNKVTFPSRDDAVNSGYSPCSVCNP